MKGGTASLLIVRVEHRPPNLGFADEWEIVATGGARIATRPTKEEADAFADGYNLGALHGKWSV